MITVTVCLSVTVTGPRLSLGGSFREGVPVSVIEVWSLVGLSAHSAFPLMIRLHEVTKLKITDLF